MRDVVRWLPLASVAEQLVMDSYHNLQMPNFKNKMRSLLNQCGMMKVACTRRSYVIRNP
jgi:hypothetical protein